MTPNPIAEIAAAPQVAFRGIQLPALFTDVTRECAALRQGTAVYDGSLRAWIRMRGEDRVDFLQGMISNDVKALRPGDSLYAAMLTQQGRVVADLRVHAAADHFLLDFPAHVAAAAQAALEKFIVADDVEMEVDDAILIGVEGPGCARILETVARGAAITELAEIEIAGRRVLLAPGGEAGESGVLLGTSAADADAVWQALRTAGAQPIGFEAIDVSRLESGIPWVGVDMDGEMLIMETDLEHAISFKKGCYLGQEVVERVASRGHVNRKRVGLILSGDPVAPPLTLHAGDQEVGWLTSSVRSPRLGKTIGMGYVRREHLTPGTVLRSSAGAEVVVAALPFIAPARGPHATRDA